MEIRQLLKSDIPACVEIFMESYNRLPWNYNWKFDDAVVYLTEYFDSKQFVGYVIVDNGAIAGAMFGHKKTWWTNNQLFIDELFVSHKRQGAGFGKKLIQHAEGFCKDNGVEMITLMTNKFMPALKFYDAIDFVKVDQFVFMFKQIE